MTECFAMLDVTTRLYDGETKDLREAERYNAPEADAIAREDPKWEIVPVFPMSVSKRTRRHV